MKELIERSIINKLKDVLACEKDASKAMQETHKNDAEWRTYWYLYYERRMTAISDCIRVLESYPIIENPLPLSGIKRKKMKDEEKTINCPLCEGHGVIIEQQCCMRPGYECCGDPELVQVPCSNCQATGLIPITLP